MARTIEAIANEMLTMANISDTTCIITLTSAELRMWATEIIEAKNDAVKKEYSRGVSEGYDRGLESHY